MTDTKNPDAGKQAALAIFVKADGNAHQHEYGKELNFTHCEIEAITATLAQSQPSEKTDYNEELHKAVMRHCAETMTMEQCRTLEIDILRVTYGIFTIRNMAYIPLTYVLTLMGNRAMNKIWRFLINILNGFCCPVHWAAH